MKFILKCMAAVSLVFPLLSHANSVNGRITQIQVPTNDDVNSVYFKIDPMPAGVAQWFYIRYGTGDSAGCSVRGNEDSFSRAYSTLLAAHLAKRTINIVYCVDSNGYGLVNQHIGVLE
ncbi:hypothetical protein [Rheinheimera sp. NSM]|uniref:hypothetical protein n=1 Tax=Rheinheimera sp. NSM TaxID=3457884 RepID=UPI0040372C5B